MVPTPEIRTTTRQEVDLAVAWADREGWNPGLRDAEAFHAADADGFLIACVAGEPVAVCSAVRHGEGFGFIGFYIVAPSWRGRGYGLAIWQAAMQRLKGRLIGLDGVVAQQGNYARSGFALAYRQVRHTGLTKAAKRPDAGLRPLASWPLAQWLAYDRQCFPEDRRAYIQAWMEQPGTVALGLRDGGELRGFGAIRPCQQGYKIGPLFADSAEGAERLFVGLGAAVPEGVPVSLDTPAIHRDAMDLAARHGMRAVFETARMYAGGEPDLDIRRQYGVTSFELG